NQGMSAVALHFASGAAFFSGSVCLAAAMAAITLGRRKLLRALGRLVLLVSLFMIVASATPLPVWVWALWGSVLLLWLGSLHPRLAVWPKWKASAFAIGALCIAGAIAWELPFHLPPRIPDEMCSRLVVIGDSLSAEDFTEGGEPWPRLLAREHP